MKSVLIIPAEGDSVETEQWYAKMCQEHYRCRVAILEHSENRNIQVAIAVAVDKFFCRVKPYEKFEIHAQGGLGAATAYYIMRNYPQHVERVFFVGGAPSSAMTLIAKFFHRIVSFLWYLSHIPFFADDPNPYNDKVIAKIRESSTRTMRRNPKLYYRQLRFIGKWKPAEEWRMPDRMGFFVPNGVALQPKWWANTYNNTKAMQAWYKHNVRPTITPENCFSFYSMMPAKELFIVMDYMREF